VAVVTARDANGAPVGLTASSFTALSLDPPLVLFCLGQDSTSQAAMQATEGFAVHVLAADQAALSGRFAGRGGDMFEALQWSEGRYGAPLLDGCLAVLECRVHSRVPGGDHIIMVGTVERASVAEGDPLIYYRAAYRSLGAKPG
jgi:flavin reductase (DIM6/NTAB) family NADH-FMN oxidoreductase RutF